MSLLDKGTEQYIAAYTKKRVGTLLKDRTFHAGELFSIIHDELRPVIERVVREELLLALETGGSLDREMRVDAR